VLNANVAFRGNCPNFDLVVFNRAGPVYVQVRSSKKPWRPGRIILGAWNKEKLAGASLFNEDPRFPAASVVLIVVVWPTGETEFYLAPPEELDKAARPSALAFAKKPKRDGTLRSPNFRAEVPKGALANGEISGSCSVTRPSLRALHQPQDDVAVALDGLARRELQRRHPAARRTGSAD
jgi:hypothetical protein